MRVRLIVNPVAGDGTGTEAGEALRRALRHLVHSVDVVMTAAPGHALEAARADGADCLVAVGGDGSLNEVANGAPAGRTLGIFPAGTANVVARELGVPRRAEDFAALVARASSRCIDAGVNAGRRFLLGAGAGLDAAVVTAVAKARGIRRGGGLHRWVAPTIRTVLRYGYPRIAVDVDGERISDQAHWVIVGNCVYSAGLFPATPHAKLDDGLLDVCVVERIHPLKIAALALQVWNPRFLRRRDVRYRQGRRITLTPMHGTALVPMQVDGDPAGFAPAEFQILPGAVRIIAPTPAV